MSEASAYADAEARHLIEHDLDATVFVEAAAGTGKTTALVGRIVSLLKSGAGTLDRVVAVTFTEKAAGELKLRLRAEIESARTQAPSEQERRHLERSLEHLELARISTIHGFCSDLLHERPVEAGVDPLFAIAAEDEQKRLLDRAFDEWFERVLSDPPEGVRRILRRRPRGFNARGPRETLRGAVQALVEHRDFDASWRRDPFEREASIDRVLTALEAFGALADSAQDPEDWLARNVANVARWLADNALVEKVRGRDHDALEAELRVLRKDRRIGWHYKGRRRNMYSDELTRDELLECRAEVQDALEALVANCDADLAACLREELRPVVASYQEHKKSAGVLDFVDLLIAARDLLVASPDARSQLQERFSHYFVDEFQDTDPLQAEILLLLASDDPDETDWLAAKPHPGKLFLVGDPKQAIYRFRRADVAIYESTKQRLALAGARVLQLTTSFRAPPSLQAVVNAAFEPLMQGAADGGQAQYVPLEGARDEVQDRPTLVALPVPAPYGDYGTVVNFRIDDSLPEAVGAYVHWLVNDSGWTVKERDAEGREVDAAIRPRHVCLLFRRFKSFRQDVTRPYVRALEARRVAHVLVGGRSFHEREEVLAIRNALAAIEWPDDELRVFATLRGPLFALGDDALLAFKDVHRTLHPLQPLEDIESMGGDERDVAESLRVLRRLHHGRNRRPLADTVSQLLEAVRAHAGIAIWPTGEQALANCLRIVDLARRFERFGAPSFRAFVERLDEDAERGEAQDAPVVEEGTEGVRIMTAHRAKGLEFPVVILCDPTCRATRDEPTRLVDPTQRLWAEPLAGCTPRELMEQSEAECTRDRHEAVRLTYVAATRARDLLVVPVVADKELEDSWLDPLMPTVYPDTAARGEGEPYPGCPAFGSDAIVHRPRDARRPPRAQVRPGRLWPRAGSHPVVWWDPNVLSLDAELDVGLRQQRVLEADASGSAVEAGERKHEQWRSALTARLVAGMEPSLAAASVTSLAEASPDAGDVDVQEVTAKRGARPYGARFGTLVHALLAEVDLDAEPSALEAAARLQGRLVDATEQEVSAAAEAARAALEHPLLRRAAASDALRRETPVLLQTDEGTLAEGIVDLAFRESGGWIVVDFKTDRDLEAKRDVYAAQVRLYAEAVSRATGEPARATLLVV